MTNRVEESLNLFNKKCAMIDLPPLCYPDPQYLRKIFRQNLSFFELFSQKVDTKYAVEAIRTNILIAHMKNSVQDTKSLKTKNSLPKEFQKYIRYNQLLEKVKELKERQHYQKQEELQKLQELEKIDINKIKAKELSRHGKVKLDILQAKLLNINLNIQKEEVLQNKIKDITPAKFSSSDCLDDFYNNVCESISVLQEFSACENNDDNIHLREKSWKKIESNLKRVPNNVLFQMILKQLGSKIEDSILSSSSAVKFQPVKVSEKLLPLLYQQKILSGLETLAIKKRLEASKKSCADKIQTFENEIEGLLNASIDFSFEEDDIVGQLLSMLIAKVSLEGKILFCSNHVKAMKENIESNTSMIEYDQLVKDTQNTYNFIDEKLTAIQEHAAQVHQINERINFSKISIMRMIQSLKIEKSQQFNRTLLNQTLNNTVIFNKESEVSLPKHEMEIQQFLEIPIQSFDRAVRTDRLLSHEDIVANVIHIFGIFSDSRSFFTNLDKRIKFGNLVKSLSHEVTPSTKQVTSLNYDDIQKQRYENSVEISSMFDEISRMNVTISSNLRAINLLYNFVSTNPLKRFVPKTKKFDGKSYEFYEKEYMLYYKMIKN